MIYNIAFGKAYIKSLKKLNDKDKMLVRDTVELLASGLNSCKNIKIML